MKKKKDNNIDLVAMIIEAFVAKNEIEWWIDIGAF